MEQTYWVKPLEPIKPETIKLPPPDQVGVNIIVPRVLGFLTTADYNEEAFIKIVQTAVAGLLTEMPILAGTVTWEDKARHRMKLVIPPDAKVQVVIAQKKHLDALELDKQYWAPRLMGEFRIQWPPPPVNGIDTYNFALQVNLLQNGVALTLHTNHIILDGSAQASIESVFAHHLSEAMDGKPYSLSGRLSPGSLDKSLPKGTHPARPILDWKDWKEGGPNPLEFLTKEQIMELVAARIAQCSLTIWHVPMKKILELRERNTDPGSKERPLSTAMYLAGMMWKAVGRARQHDPDTKATMLTPVQTRGRVPELPPTWSGSALVYGRATATPEEFEKTSAYELGRRIERSVKWWTAERIREYWGSIEEVDDIGIVAPNQNRDFGTDIEISSVANFPLWKLPWGRWLKIRGWRAPGQPFSDGWILVSPQLPSGELELHLYLGREVLERLVDDKEFRSFATYRCGSDEEFDELAAATAPAGQAKL